MTRVSDAMTRGVRTLSPDDTVVLAAQAMDELNVGSIPVCDGQRLVGMITDRDIAVRGVAQELPHDTPLKDLMSSPVKWCSEDASVDEAARTMQEAQIRRLPVVDSKHCLVGVIALGDLAVKTNSGTAGETLEAVSRPSAPDRSGISIASGAAGGGSASGKASRTPG